MEGALGALLVVAALATLAREYRPRGRGIARATITPSETGYVALGLVASTYDPATARITSLALVTLDEQGNLVEEYAAPTLDAGVVRRLAGRTLVVHQRSDADLVRGEALRCALALESTPILSTAELSWRLGLANVRLASVAAAVGAPTSVRTATERAHAVADVVRVIGLGASPRQLSGRPTFLAGLLGDLVMGAAEAHDPRFAGYVEELADAVSSATQAPDAVRAVTARAASSGLRPHEIVAVRHRLLEGLRDAAFRHLEKARVTRLRVREVTDLRAVAQALGVPTYFDDQVTAPVAVPDRVGSFSDPVRRPGPPPPPPRRARCARCLGFDHVSTGCTRDR